MGDISDDELDRAIEATPRLGLSSLSSSSKHMLRAAKLLREMAKCGVPKHMKEQAESLANSLEISLVMRRKP
jgi:hypothetical protein